MERLAAVHLRRVGAAGEMPVDEKDGLLTEKSVWEDNGCVWRGSLM